jgi:hypothetical protein
VNNSHDVDGDAHEQFVSDVAEWTLGLEPGTLRATARSN